MTPAVEHVSDLLWVYKHSYCITVTLSTALSPTRRLPRAANTVSSAGHSHTLLTHMIDWKVARRLAMLLKDSSSSLKRSISVWKEWGKVEGDMEGKEWRREKVEDMKKGIEE